MINLQPNQVKLCDTSLIYYTDPIIMQKKRIKKKAPHPQKKVPCGYWHTDEGIERMTVMIKNVRWLYEDDYFEEY